jgi:hypothetical protein
VSPGSLQAQPIELIDYISSFVDNPKDLLAFSLTSKRICDVIVPNHIECRHLRCDFRRLSLWKALLEYPAIAGRFVSIEIVDEDSPGGYPGIIVPSVKALPFYVFSQEDKLGSDWVASQVELEVTFKNAVASCLQTLVTVLRSMPHLLRFHWHYYFAPTNDVFDALMFCHGLTDVEVSYDAELFPGLNSITRCPVSVATMMITFLRVHNVFAAVGAVKSTQVFIQYLGQRNYRRCGRRVYGSHA